MKKPDASVLPSGDKGRFAVTKTQSDEYVFRAAPLRNVALTAPYFHSGQVWELKDAVAIMGNAPARQAVGAGRRGNIVAFLHSLSGKQPRVEISAAAGQHRNHAASRGITATENGAPWSPVFPLWDDLRPRPAPASHRRP